MQDATLCYPVRDDDDVLLIRKKRGVGAGKFVGPGGKVEGDESVRECAVRETREEVGLEVHDLRKVGAFEFVYGDDTEFRCHVFVTRDFSGDPEETPEAVPHWFDRHELPFDRMWDDDRLWLPDALDGETFEGRFVFDDAGDEMVEHELVRGVSF